ncbi:MAG: lipopolysaccharide kinase InaA family protein [Planctomycetota bacterium]
MAPVLGGDWTPLKVRGKRSVFRFQPADGSREIVKRFHSNNWLKDWWRARREMRGLDRWAAAGLPCPHPARVELQRGRWELHMPEIAGARNLLELLAAGGPWPQGENAAADGLGALIARMDALGLMNGDPHPGNVLLDPQGRWWLIDPSPEPIGSGRTRPDFARWIRWAAQVREISSNRFRLRVLRAYRRAAGPGEVNWKQGGLASSELELRAAAFEWGRQRAQRWLRTSGATERRGSALLTRGATDGTAVDGVDARSWWLGSAQAVEQRLPCAVPAWWDADRSPSLAYQPPGEGRRWQGPPDAAALGRLHGLLHDRGWPLDLPLGPLFVGPNGHLWFVAQVAAPPSPSDFRRPSWPRAALAAMPPVDRERYRQAFFAALGLSRGRRAELEPCEEFDGPA